MADGVASNENHLLIRIDERVKGLDKKVDRFIEHQEKQDLRIQANKDDITTHREQLSNVAKVFGVIELGVMGVLAYLGLRP